MILFINHKQEMCILPVCFRLTVGYSGSDLTALAKDASLGPIRGELHPVFEILSQSVFEILSLSLCLLYGSMQFYDVLYG